MPSKTTTMRRNDKGWTSERTIPSPRGGGNNISIVRNPISTSPLSPLASGRTLPSKWDDAERWICSPSPSPSPVSSHHPHPINTNSGGGTPPPVEVCPARRPKSKSGPLGQPTASLDAAAGHVSSSPAASTNYCFSPFNTGVMTADAVLLGLVRRNGGVLDERFNGVGLEDDVIDDPRAVSRRDMATQMSPRSSICSSPKARASFSHCHSPPSRGDFPARPEVRDVTIDKRATIISWSKRHASRISGKPWWTESRDRSDGFSQEVVEASSAWQFGNTGKNTPWVQREEARITAWENLQKAKAEAAIRKLEMKLEKRRSSSMERIQSKLKAAETKARDMRGSLWQDRDDRRKAKPIRRWFRCDSF